MAQSSNQETGQDIPCDQYAEISDSHHTWSVWQLLEVLSWQVLQKFSGSLNTNIEKLTTEMLKKSSESFTASLFQTGETVHLFPAFSLTSLMLKTQVKTLHKFYFNNSINPIHHTSNYQELKNLKTNTDIIHLLSTVSQAPVKKIHKAVGELLGNSDRVEEVTEHGLLKKMAQSSALFCKEPTSILTPHLLLTLCSTMCLLAFGQAVWYTWLVEASVCFNTLTLCCAIAVQSLSIKKTSVLPGRDDLPWLWSCLGTFLFYNTTYILHL